MVSPIDDTRGPIGGAQALLADLAKGLASRGHDVTLLGADGSRLERVRVPALGIDSSALRPASLGATQGARPDDLAQNRAFASVRKWIDEHIPEIDLIHAHAYDAAAFDALRGARRPVLHTLHLPPLDASVVRAAHAARDATLVTVSGANARAWREQGVPVTHVVHNGIDLNQVPVGQRRGTHLICAGRVSPEKGTHIAVAVARRRGRSLVVAGGVYDDAYFESRVAPHVRRSPEWRLGDPIEDVVYVGPRKREELLTIMGSSAALLMPVLWDEPFGLVALESLATGTPVIAYRRGGLAEIVDETCGVLVEPDDEDALERAIGIGPELAGDPCRRRSERFSLTAMLAAYEGVYRIVTGALV
jgi:UDP-glucose:tetrahydrobiopterin glucosyltransferase